MSDVQAVLSAPPGGRPLLQVEGVGKRFGAVVALADVDLVVHRGEIVALAGENGSGKSTLSKIVAGVHRPDDGRVFLDGAPVTFTRPRDALDAGIALVTQELTAVPTMSVAENVLLTGLRPAGVVNRRDLQARALPLLRTVGLDVDPRLPFAQLGQGDRELVEVAKALAADPRLLILDEATTRLPDPERLFALVERLAAEQGVATIFITHRLREIRRLAHRTVVLRDGRRAGALARSELSDQAISAMMVGRELSEFFHKPQVRPGRVLLQVDEVVTDRSAHPISFDVAAGEVVGVAGLVGAGRSELLETLAGARVPRGGAVAVDGEPLPSGSVRAAIDAGVTLVPEDRRTQGLVLGASIDRNVSMGSFWRLWRTDARAERRRAHRAVDDLSIRCAGVDALVSTLSGGNQQKVVLGRTLATEPKVLLLDEPTRGVDIGAREEIYRLIGTMVTDGMAVLVASSDLMELLGLCDRIVVLFEGAVAGVLERQEATEERLALLFAGGSLEGVPA